LHRVEEVLQRDLRVDYEVLIVDDGSLDGTKREALRYARGNGRVRVVSYPDNGGKGKALQRGFRLSRGRFVCFFDGDLEIDPVSLVGLVREIRKGAADIVIGSKRHSASIIRYPLHRRMLSRSFQLMCRAMFRLPARDTQVGAKVFRREVLEALVPRLRLRHFAFDLELLVLAYRDGFRVQEAPVVVDMSRANGSSVEVRDILRVGWDALHVFYWSQIAPEGGPRETPRNV
jgi:glycosyltransferase involved in cell wall biosynthesis